MSFPGPSAYLLAMGSLFLVSTPIGNLDDLSVRAVRVLGDVDVVLAEDTRRTGQLLRHLELSVPLLSLHAHNERQREREVLERLDRGAAVALVSDAGTPLVSDPGERLVRSTLDAGHEVVPIPGPSAVLAALVGSGLPTLPFVFLGFAPRKGRTRADFIRRCTDSSETVVFFESPHRLGRTLSELAEASGPERGAAVARELTKLHEEFVRGTLGELADYYSGTPPPGEVTVVLAPAESGVPEQDLDRKAGRALAEALLAEGFSSSRAAKEVARRLGIPRNRAYALVQELSAEPGEGSLPSSQRRSS